MNKYDQIMEKIKVTEPMQQRILENIEKELKQEKKKRYFSQSVKYLSAVACFVLLIVGIYTIPYMIEKEPDVGKTESFQIVEVDSAQELSKKLGYRMDDIKSLLNTAEKVEYILYGDLGEITYDITAGDITSGKCIYRKAQGNQDISGNYEVYDNVSTIDFQNIKVTVKGKPNQTALAIWTKDGYSYSLQFEKPVNDNVLLKLIAEIDE